MRLVGGLLVAEIKALAVLDDGGAVAARGGLAVGAVHLEVHRVVDFMLRVEKGNGLDPAQAHVAEELRVGEFLADQGESRRRVEEPRFRVGHPELLAGVEELLADGSGPPGAVGGPP